MRDLLKAFGLAVLIVVSCLGTMIIHAEARRGAAWAQLPNAVILIALGLTVSVLVVVLTGAAIGEWQTSRRKRCLAAVALAATDSETRTAAVAALRDACR